MFFYCFFHTLQFFDISLTSFLKPSAEDVNSCVDDFIHELGSELAQARLDGVEHSQVVGGQLQLGGDHLWGEIREIHSWNLNLYKKHKSRMINVDTWAPTKDRD